MTASKPKVLSGKQLLSSFGYDPGPDDWALECLVGLGLAEETERGAYVIRDLRKKCLYLHRLLDFEKKMCYNQSSKQIWSRAESAASSDLPAAPTTRPAASWPADPPSSKNLRSHHAPQEETTAVEIEEPYDEIFPSGDFSGQLGLSLDVVELPSDISHNKQCAHAGNDVETAASALCNKLADMMETRGLKRPNVTQHWEKAASRLLRLDGPGGGPLPYDEVVRVLEWSQRDEFWCNNILSMPKFRMKYQQLKLKSEGGRRFAPVQSDLEAAGRRAK